MNIPLGNYVSVSDVQRDYRKVFDKAKKTKQTVMVMRDNQPYVAVVDVDTLSELQKKVEEMEIADTLEAIRIAEKEKREGKLKVLRFGSLAKIVSKE